MISITSIIIITIVIITSVNIYIYIYISQASSRTFACTRGFRGYCFKDDVKGPQFEETTTNIIKSLFVRIISKWFVEK